MIRIIFGMFIGIVLMSQWEDQTVMTVDFLKNKTAMLLEQDLNAERSHQDAISALKELPMLTTPEESDEPVDSPAFQSADDFMDSPEFQPPAPSPVKSQSPSWTELQKQILRSRGSKK